SDSIASHIVSGTNYIQVHPTFLYESMWNLGVLILMLLLLKHRKYNGEETLLYFGGYGLGRAWIEYIRTDQLYLIGTTIPVSMVLAIIMVVVSLFLHLYVKKRLHDGKSLHFTTYGSDGRIVPQNVVEESEKKA
ncbi:MAG TPA: hypothetical protein DGX96_00945, partial [Lachnospiraceae bacterium]|nr:hypothetical protein [Lachnospiraceae bacterium]